MVNNREGLVSVGNVDYVYTTEDNHTEDNKTPGSLHYAIPVSDTEHDIH